MGAFAAVKEDGSLTYVGAFSFWRQQKTDVKSELSGGVDRVVGTELAFAAVKQDGFVVTWGGGNSESVKSELSGGVDHVVGNAGAFCCSQRRRLRCHVGPRRLWRRLRQREVRVARRRASGEGQLARLRPV